MPVWPLSMPLPQLNQAEEAPEATAGHRTSTNPRLGSEGENFGRCKLRMSGACLYRVDGVGGPLASGLLEVGFVHLILQ